MLAGDALNKGLINGIVPDRDALIAQISKEISMDKAQLAASHPELLAQIQAEARAEAESALAAAHTQAQADSSAGLLALVKAVAGEDAAAKIAQAAAIGITAEQIAAYAQIFGQPQASAAEAEGEESANNVSRREILTALREARPAPLNTQAGVKNGDPVAAAIDRISAL